jgi:hypothetical protein
MGTRKTNLEGEGGGLTSRGKGVSPSWAASVTKRFDKNRFIKAQLPAPISVLARLGITPKSAGRAGYWLVKCPLHKNGKEQHASLSIHQVNGNFRCFTCGACGGDVLSLWMKYTGKRFKQAAMELGAWGLQP